MTGEEVSVLKRSIEMNEFGNGGQDEKGDEMTRLIDRLNEKQLGEEKTVTMT